jgi:hypothetical protein
MVKNWNPLFTVELYTENKRRHYILKLSEENFNYLLAGCPDVDRLIGRYTDTNTDAYFNILRSQNDESSKEIMPEDEHGDIYIHIGAKTPTLPENWTKTQFNTAIIERDKNLEDAINTFKKIPIIELYESKPIIISYVSMELEK